MTDASSGIRKISVQIKSSRSWPVIIGNGVIDSLGSLFDFEPYSSIVIVADFQTNRLYGERIAGILKTTGKKIHTIVVPVGEGSKSLEEAGQGYRFLMENGIDRKGLLCLLGGGVVGDLGGYIAATYLRGLDYIQLPTTLLAQVDSSIGGKVGVNFGGKKNIIGSFYQPKAIISDVSFLESLSPGEMRNGFAEIIKYGVAMDRELFRQLNSKETIEFAPSELVDLVERCCRLKLRIVKADEMERTGRRAILNFGHTVGHAIEASSGLTDRHGEAIAVGMLAAARLSERMGMLNGRSTRRIEDLLVRFGLPTRYRGMTPDRLVDSMRFDKKSAGGEVKWVLLEKIGRGIVNCTVKDSLVKEVLREMQE